jgi:hypothetical protein
MYTQRKLTYVVLFFEPVPKWGGASNEEKLAKDE